MGSTVGGAGLVFGRFSTDPRVMLVETTVEIIELFPIFGFSRFHLLSIRTADRTGERRGRCRIQI